MKKTKWVKFIIVNLITLSRLIGSIVLPIIYFIKGINSLAFFVIMLFLTDLIDGKLSRLWKVESFLGSLMDGICDKIFAFVMISILSYEYKLMLIVLLLEFIIFGINTLAFSENKNVQSSKMGKFKTFVLDVSISLLFLYSAREFYQSVIPDVLNTFIINTKLAFSYVIIGIVIGTELLTISDYSKNRLKQTEFKKLKGKHLKSKKEIWEMLIDREFYIKNKDERLKHFLYKEKNF